VPGDVFVLLTDILLDHDLEQLREAARSQPGTSPSALAQIAAHERPQP
jgi:hypothetical protein